MDIADILAFYIFSIPIVGDIADLVAILILFPMIGKYGIINLAEFLPGEDPLPTFTVSVFLAHMQVLDSPYHIGIGDSSGP